MSLKMNRTIPAKTGLIIFMFLSPILSRHANGVLKVEILPEKRSGSEVFFTKFQSIISGGSGFYSYSWDFDAQDGIGTDKISEHPSFVFAKPGEYVVTLTVSDSEGRSASDTCRIEVTPTQFQKSSPIEINGFHPREPYIIENLEITNSDGNGITVRNSSNIIIRNNNIHDLQSSDPFGDPGQSGCAIYLFDCEKVTITNNICTNNQGGILVDAARNGTDFKKNIRILNNIIMGSKYYHTIDVFMIDSLVIENNYAYNNGDLDFFEKHRTGGIWVWDASHIIINDNMTILSSSDGIGVATTEQMMKSNAHFLCNNFIISNNTIKRNYEMGIWLTGVREGEIFANYVDSNYGPGSSGINLEWNCSHIHVYKNIIQKNFVCGIHSNNSFDNEIYENIIFNETGGHGAIWMRQAYSSGTYIYPLTDSRNNIIRNNLIYNNSHAIKIDGNKDPALKLVNTTIANNTIDGNDMYWENDGSGIIIQNEADSITIINNIISNNKGIGIVGNNKNIYVAYNNLWNNGRGNYLNIARGIGDISKDPNYVDRLNGNYHLSPNSPSVDAGDPASEYANEPHPHGNRINQGCYGNTPEATISMEPIGPVDFADLAVYPVPFYFSRDAAITFLNVPLNTDLVIYNILGHKVHKQERLNRYEVKWRPYPNSLNSGVYFYRLSDDTGIKKYGKITILK